MDAGVTLSPLIDTQAVAKLLNTLKMLSLKALNSYRFGRNVGVWGKSYINNPKMVTTEAVRAVTATRNTLKTKLEENSLCNKHFSKKVSIELGKSPIYCFR